MIILSQYDQRWARVTLGKTPYTLARWGCLVTSCSMASDYYKQYHAPDDLAKTLEFTSQGNMIWQSLPKATNFKLKERFYTWDTVKLNEGLKDPKTVSLVNVGGFHWCIVVGRDLLNARHYMIFDPLGGKKVSTKKYGFISGGAILTLK